MARVIKEVVLRSEVEVDDGPGFNPLVALGAGKVLLKGAPATVEVTWHIHEVQPDGTVNSFQQAGSAEEA